MRFRSPVPTRVEDPAPASEPEAVPGVAPVVAPLNPLVTDAPPVVPLGAYPELDALDQLAVVTTAVVAIAASLDATKAVVRAVASDDGFLGVDVFVC